MRPAVLASLIALALPLAPTVAASKSVAAGKPWTKVVTATPQGTYVLGNPAAKVKLVEYFSFTCAHCAHFHQEASPALQRHIARGDVSLELRNAVRDRFDLVASLLSRCTGPRGVFAATDTLLAAQPLWLERGLAFESGEGGRLAGVARDDALATLAQRSGMQAMVQKHGLPPAAVKRCLSDEKAIGQLSSIAGEAWRERKIRGTPTLLLNGAVVQDGASWNKLEPAIVAALR